MVSAVLSKGPAVPDTERYSGAVFPHVHHHARGWNKVVRIGSYVLRGMRQPTDCKRHADITGHAHG